MAFPCYSIVVLSADRFLLIFFNLSFQVRGLHELAVAAGCGRSLTAEVLFSLLEAI